ncbi:5-formyltetrahydrofolate cyclo-ligase [Virgibacillus necropolis]|uniref:5-formyltetrahydrofolate cyclo-ligase n=1 Tax=Virgibacillus necropolis TaxID=163877 RepID=A0A221MC92_9BACI|nr:5-formyltetrahydrofolate cyclo-ligase [Virgibacillus necropolis]ASN05230.1 5-formyltetrahydrofolate cyclo-ligase [Virgibacillus necropolis]
MNKSELRNKAITYLKSLSDEEKLAVEGKITNQLIQSDLWKKSSSIGITISQGFEWNTKTIIDTAWKEDKQVSVPKCDPSIKALTFYQLKTYEQLEVVYYNLKEPDPSISKFIEKNQLDLLIVPGLVFDQKGYRIGFGGGYYDRFLKDFSNTTVSLVSNDQLTQEIPREEFDLPVDYIVTETGIY